MTMPGECSLTTFEMACIGLAVIVAIMLGIRPLTLRVTRQARIRRLHNRFAGAPLHRLSVLRRNRVQLEKRPADE